jgi:hypothetical protein
MSALARAAACRKHTGFHFGRIDFFIYSSESFESFK